MNWIKDQNILSLIIFILICLFAEVVGSYLTFTSVKDWYPTVAKPSWTPPSWLFGPVWTTLYILMGISAWMVWKEGGFQQNPFALGIFFIQLAINVLWSGFFFGLQGIGLALINIVILWVLIIAMVITFWQTKQMAGVLNIPYWLWVSYATALNFQIWRMNS